MIQTASQTLSDRSRLVRLLTELSDTKYSSNGHNLAEQLGRLISVSDSIALSRSLGQLSYQSGKRMDNRENISESAYKVREAVLFSREQMINTIIQSFASEPSGTGIQAPSLAMGTRVEALQTYEPYQRFYSMHQAEMAGSIQNLRLRVRVGVSEFSTELHQLAELDKILSESLAIHTAKLFNGTPKLLEQRFKQLLEAYRQKTAQVNNTEPRHWLMPGGWLELFYRDMQELLLAELDVRLQPVLGLLEALNEHIPNVSA